MVTRMVWELALKDKTYEWHVKRISEAETRCYCDNGINAWEDCSKQQHLANMRIDRHSCQVVTKWSQSLSSSVQRILLTDMSQPLQC